MTEFFARAQLAIERRTSRQLPHASFLQVHCSMDIFVPPGWMTRTELVNLTGQALVKDEWLGAMPTTAELLRADLELRAMLMPERKEMLFVGPGSGLEVRSPERVLSENLAGTSWPAKRQRNQETDMHDHVVAVLRTQLCSGIIPAAVKTPEGLIVDIPPPFWQGSRAIPAFDTEEATVYHGPEIGTTQNVCSSELIRDVYCSSERRPTHGLPVSMRDRRRRSRPQQGPPNGFELKSRNGEKTLHPRRILRGNGATI